MKTFQFKSKYDEPELKLEKEPENKPVYGKRTGKIVGYEKQGLGKSNNKNVNNDFVNFIENGPNYALYSKKSNSSESSNSSSSSSESSEVEESSIEGSGEDEEEEEEVEEKLNITSGKKSFRKKEQEQTYKPSQVVDSQSLNADDIKKKVSQMDKNRYEKIMKEFKNDQNSQIPDILESESNLIYNRNPISSQITENLVSQATVSQDPTKKQIKLYQRKSKNTGNSQQSNLNSDSPKKIKEEDEEEVKIISEKKAKPSSFIQKPKELSNIIEEKSERIDTILEENKEDKDNEKLVEKIEPKALIEEKDKKNGKGKVDVKELDDDKETKNIKGNVDEKEIEDKKESKIVKEKENIKKKNDEEQPKNISKVKSKVNKKKKNKNSSFYSEKMLQHISNPVATTKELSSEEKHINNTKAKRDKVDEITEIKEIKNKSPEKKDMKKKEEKSDKKRDKKIEDKKKETEKRIENTVKTNLPIKKNTDKIDRNNTKKKGSFEEKSVENSNDEMDIAKSFDSKDIAKSFDSNKAKKKENISKEKKPLIREENIKENKNLNNTEKTVIHVDEENVYNNEFLKDINNKSEEKDLISEDQENSKINKNKRKYGQNISQNNIEESMDDKEKPRSKKKRKIDKNGKIVLTETQYLKTIFKQLEEQNVKYFPIKEEKQEYFGVDNRYPRRKRFPVLNPIIGERLAYGVRMNNDTKVPEVIGIYRNNQFVREFQKEHQLKPPKKRLVKKADKDKKSKTDTKLENLEETNKDGDNSEEDDNKKKDDKEEKELKSNFYKVDKESTKLKTVFIIPKECEKPKAKNYDVKIECEVIETDGENCFITGTKKREKLKPGESFFISPNEVFSFQNFSTKKDMKVSLTVIK